MRDSRWLLRSDEGGGRTREDIAKTHLGVTGDSKVLITGENTSTHLPAAPRDSPILLSNLIAFVHVRRVGGQSSKH